MVYLEGRPRGLRSRQMDRCRDKKPLSAKTGYAQRWASSEGVRAASLFGPLVQLLELLVSRASGSSHGGEFLFLLSLEIMI